MGEFFKKASTNAKKLEEELLGPTYQYHKWLRTPSEMGMSDRGSLSVTADNVAGLINYMQVLIAGTGPASMTNKPLGNKFFLKVGGQCKSPSGKLVDRYTYIDNVPDGSIPMLTSQAGVTFSSMKGLIPGMMSNIVQMNPMMLFSGFMDGAEPDCTEISMPVIDINNNKSSERHHVANSEIADINPCSFPGKKNPKTNVGCRSAFTNRNYAKNLKDKPFANIYLLLFSLGLVYFTYKIMIKKR